MHKIRIAGLMLVVLILGSALMVSSQETMEELCIPMGSILLEPPESVSAKKPAVEFPHSAHFDFNCKDCHHKWDNQSQIDSCSTSGCHDLLESPKKANKAAVSDAEAVRYFKNAFHKTCITCHKDIKTANIEAEMKLRLSDNHTIITNVGPTTCKGCHQPE